MLSRRPRARLPSDCDGGSSQRRHSYPSARPFIDDEDIACLRVPYISSSTGAAPQEGPGHLSNRSAARPEWATMPEFRQKEEQSVGDESRDERRAWILASV